ncbi:MAG: peptidylprolyl isomerase [Gemmataceae bacterium]|nr:peptidylprolyl isomerase [Gemmataceae bacterium]
MTLRCFLWVSIVVACLSSSQTAFCQAPEEKTPPPKKVELPPPPPPPAADAVAATVNGTPIPEIAVYRGMLRGPNTPEARKEVVNYLVDNLIVDQYLVQLKIEPEAKEIDAKLGEIKEEASKNKQDFDDLLKKLHLSEAELRKELTGALRWDKFVNQQGTEKVLKDFYDKNTTMFDGSQVQARHILIKGDAEKAKATLASVRKAIEDDVAKAMQALPAEADALTKEKTRISTLSKAFAEQAGKHSECPSKAQGGDLGWFPRAGAMVEPFARAAFALKPTQMSDAVVTEFGHHLILSTDTKAGRQLKFEEIRPFVLEVYGDKLREAVLNAYKPRAKIEITEMKK